MGQLDKRFPIYSRLLRLYPAVYYAAYREQMLQTLADMLDHTQSTMQRVGIWTRLLFDFSFSVGKQQVSDFGGVMKREMPSYVKRNALVGAILLLPFTLVLIANRLDQTMYHQPLYNSWLWNRPILSAWVLWLPVGAGLLALGSLVFLLGQQLRRTSRGNKLGVLLDIRRSWPLLLVGLAAAFIVAVVFFHDSVHCVTGSPVHELERWSETWRCIEQR